MIQKTEKKEGGSRKVSPLFAKKHETVLNFCKSRSPSAADDAAANPTPSAIFTLTRVKMFCILFLAYDNIIK